MNSQTQTQIITIIFILFFTLSLTPISLVFHILMYTSSIKSSSSETTLPCSYLSTMEKSSTLLQKAPAVTPSRTTSTASKHIPITIPAKLTQAQKEAALPFLTQEPPKPKTSTSKAKVQKII